MRTIALSLADIASESLAARRQRRAGAEHVDRGRFYPLIRAAITVVMRDVVMALLMADIVEGVPVSYATFVGYDEVAHHSGIREPDALAVLQRHDRQLGRLERATRRPRALPAGRPLRSRPDPGTALPPALRETLEEVVRRCADRGRGACTGRRGRGMGRRRRGARGRAPGAGDGWTHPEAGHAQPVGRRHGRAGPNRDALEEREGLPRRPPEKEAVVLVSGSLGLIYLPSSSERLSIEQIEEAHPRAGAGRSPPTPGSGS